MPLFEYHVIQTYIEGPPEDFGFERLDHHPELGEMILLHWSNGRDAYRACVHHVDSCLLEVFVRKIDTDEMTASTATERLRDVGKLVESARDRLSREIGNHGLAVAVVVRTYDGTSIHVGLGSNILLGSSIGTQDLIEALHATMDDFLAKCPSVIPHPEGKTS
jgi:hypothetical protein